MTTRCQHAVRVDSDCVECDSVGGEAWRKCMSWREYGHRITDTLSGLMAEAYDAGCADWVQVGDRVKLKTPGNKACCYGNPIPPGTVTEKRLSNGGFLVAHDCGCVYGWMTSELLRCV